jgi:D-glycero-alpha-D-manno-heptose-7-phosphate kinase
MIQITKTPFRISLAGGSTDLQGYLDRYGVGKVISFTPNLFTYIILKKSSTKYYKIVYSKIENVLTPEEIQNDIAREVLIHFDMPPVEVIFTADIASTGSGLASSSSYLISMIKACLEYKDIRMSSREIGKLAIEIERRFNPLAGYQDVFGCVDPYCKVLTFNKEGLEDCNYLPINFFGSYDFYLVPTEITRASTSILSTLNYEEVHKMSTTADLMLEAFNSLDNQKILDLINEGWKQKKTTSSSILTPAIKKLENKVSSIEGVLAYRLIGAGSGGYFLVICKKDSIFNLNQIKIELYNG